MPDIRVTCITTNPLGNSLAISSFKLHQSEFKLVVKKKCHIFSEVYKKGMSAFSGSISKEVRETHLVLPSSFMACLCSSSNESFIKTHTAGQI